MTHEKKAVLIDKVLEKFGVGNRDTVAEMEYLIDLVEEEPIEVNKDVIEKEITESFMDDLVIASAKSIYTKGFISGCRFAMKGGWKNVDG